MKLLTCCDKKGTTSLAEEEMVWHFVFIFVSHSHVISMEGLFYRRDGME